jgi:hypothetical protein
MNIRDNSFPRPWEKFMKSLKFVACLAVVTMGSTAYAQDRPAGQEQENARQQAGGQPQRQAELSEEDARLQEVTCRTEPVLGSRTRVTRVCMTRAEWNRLAQETRRGQDQMMRNANKNQACSFGGGC